MSLEHKTLRGEPGVPREIIVNPFDGGDGGIVDPFDGGDAVKKHVVVEDMHAFIAITGGVCPANVSPEVW